VVPAFKYPNAEVTGDPAEPVGTFNASLNVPWQFDFSNVSVVQAADCRRFLTTNELPAANAISPCEGIPRDKNFVALPLSGGGGRSAGLSAAIMWELRQRGILRHVDVISAVSGGAQAAALYALMREPEDGDELTQFEQRYVFHHSDSDNFVDIFGGNLAGDWFSSLFVPWHLVPFLFTYYDRTDVMADSFSDNYYPRGWYEINSGMRYRDTNPKRPNLLLNAVDVSSKSDNLGLPMGTPGGCFAISYEVFHDELGSDLHDFPVAQAVMASNAMPGMFYYLSLRDFSRETEKGENVYVHLADGGIRDHLGLVPINAMLRRFAEGRSLAGITTDDIAQACDFSRGSRHRSRAVQRMSDIEPKRHADGDRPVLPEKILVIVIDAARPPTGFPEESADPRAPIVDYLVPVYRALDAVDTTLDDQRTLRAVELLQVRRHLTGKWRRQNELEKCLYGHRESEEGLARCLSEVRDLEPEREEGVFGPECCPVIGMGVHNFTKYAADKFGPINAYDLDSDKLWGADLVALECFEDNDFGLGNPSSLYSEVRKTRLDMSLNPYQVDLMKKSAHALVDAMLDEFCDDATGLLAGIEEIACSPPPIPPKVECRERHLGQTLPESSR
jgi:predicted acylesterase/phospholipase RssA